MVAKNQKSALEELAQFAENNVHTIIIEGPEGCGKTYLAKQYAKMLDVSDFISIEPKVSDIRHAVDSCIETKSPMILCIENLDLGVASAAYTLLKFLEEPIPTAYIVVTCRNIMNVPDTIISRCAVTTVTTPIVSDILSYAEQLNSDKYLAMKGSRLWDCARTFKDANTILNLTSGQQEYFKSLASMLSFSDSISNMMWKLGHYPDKSETPIDLVLRYIISIAKSERIKRIAIECLSNLSTTKIATHAILAKFLFESKYIE
jgi:hypothetical protein